MEIPKMFYYDTHKIMKKFFFLVYIKIDQQNVMLFKNQEESYNIVDLYLNNNIFSGYKDSYNYYDIDADEILLFKKSENEYIVRYNYVNKMTIVPLKLKIKNFFGKIHKLKNNIALMSIESDDKRTFQKNQRNKIKNKIIELIGINNAKKFVKNTIDDEADEFIMVDVHKNTSFVEGNYTGKLVIVLHSVIDNYLKISLIQVKTHKCT